MLDREGSEGPAGVALVGDEAELRAQIGRLRDIGVTDFDAAITPVEDGASERTLEFLASLL
jgi:5,10-methylenetetrahydromethanopterin reductase